MCQGNNAESAAVKQYNTIKSSAVPTLLQDPMRPAMFIELDTPQHCSQGMHTLLIANFFWLSDNIVRLSGLTSPINFTPMKSKMLVFLNTLTRLKDVCNPLTMMTYEEKQKCPLFLGISWEKCRQKKQSISRNRIHDMWQLLNSHTDPIHLLSMQCPALLGSCMKY